MDILPFYASKLGRPVVEISTHASVLLDDGAHSITRWDEVALGLPAPTEDEIAAILAAPEPPPTADELVAYANARQWALATGGFTATIGGKAILFPTDEASLAALDRKAMRLAQPNPPASVSWQVGPTQFVTVDADEFAHAATKVDDFVQATFDALPAIFAGIASGAIKALADVDAAAWPAPQGVVS